MDYELKVSKPYSLYPSDIAWLEKRAKIETKRTGRKVSASELLTDIIHAAKNVAEHADHIIERAEHAKEAVKS